MAPERIRDTLSTHIGAPAKSIFERIWWVIKWLALFGALFLVFLWGYQGFDMGFLGLAADNVGDAISPITEPAGRATTKLSSLLSLEQAMGTYGFTADVEEYENMDKLGVEILEFKQVDERLEGRPIELQGYIEATAMEDNLELTATCSLDETIDNKGTVYSLPAQLSATVVSPEGTRAKLYKGVSEVIEFNCIFKDGIKIEKKVNSAQAKLKVNYQYITKAIHTTYYMNGDELGEMAKDGKDPFEEYGIKDPQLNSDNTITAKKTPGPMNFAIGVETRQPLRERRVYSFKTLLSQGFSSGHINYLEYLKVKVAPYIFLASDEEYGAFAPLGQGDLDAEVCDFEPSNERDAAGFKIYNLKADRLEYVNQDCSTNDLEYWGITEEECISKYKTDILARCKFLFAGELSSQTGPEADFFMAETKFIHEVTDIETVRQDQIPGKSLLIN